MAWEGDRHEKYDIGGAWLMRNLDGEEISKKKECERLEKHSMKRDHSKSEAEEVSTEEIGIRAYVTMEECL